MLTFKCRKVVETYNNAYTLPIICRPFQDDLKISEEEISDLMKHKLIQAIAEPGEPVGLLSAQVMILHAVVLVSCDMILGSFAVGNKTFC